MNKIKKALKAFGLILKRPYLLNHILNDESVHRDAVLKKYEQSKGLPVIPMGQFFSGSEVSVEPYAYLSGATMPTDLALLRLLAERFGAKRYFEIGTWRGESVANVAAVVPECVTLNLPCEEIVRLSGSEAYADLHGFFSRNLPNVRHIYGDSRTFDFAPYRSGFDLVFIDGDHHYEAVKSDTASVLPLLRDGRSIIVWHDYAYDPETIRWSVLHGILDGLPLELHHRLFHVSNTMCAVLLPDEAAQTMPSTPLEPYQEPEHFFEVNLKLKYNK